MVMVRANRPDVFLGVTRCVCDRLRGSVLNLEST